jgi:hypothetical protein
MLVAAVRSSQVIEGLNYFADTLFLRRSDTAFGGGPAQGQSCPCTAFLELVEEGRRELITRLVNRSRGPKHGDSETA